MGPTHADWGPAFLLRGRAPGRDARGALGAASAAFAVSLWATRSRLRGAAWPLVIVAALELGICVGLLVRTPPQVRWLEGVAGPGGGT